MSEHYEHVGHERIGRNAGQTRGWNSRGKGIILKKKENLEELGKTDVLSNFTIDSPVPYKLNSVLEYLKAKDTERVPADKPTRDGPLAKTEKSEKFSCIFPLNELKIVSLGERFDFVGPYADTDIS